MTDLPSLLDQLGAASIDGRALLADIRSATGEMRRAIRDAAEERKRLEQVIRDTIRADINAEATRQLTELGEKTRQAMDQAVDKVQREFARLANLLLTGNEQGSSKAIGPDLEFIAREKRRSWTGGPLP